MIRTQLELFPEEIKKGKNTKNFVIRQSSSKNFRGWNDVVASIAKNFNTSDRKYFACITDGDGTLHLHPRKNRPNPCLRIGLELRYDHAEPVYKLAEIFDLSISKKIFLKETNTQPQLKVDLSGIKAKVFLFSIYPYLLERKDKARKVLLALDCGEKYLPKEKQF